MNSLPNYLLGERCAWFLARFPNAGNKFIIKELGNAGDEELGSEDSEGDDDY